MDERRSALEWTFDALAALGLVVTFVSGMIFRRSGPPDYDYWALASAWVGVALLIGGIYASRRCKQRRLARLIRDAQGNHAN